MTNVRGHGLDDLQLQKAQPEPTPAERQIARLVCAEHAYDTADLLDLLQLLGLDDNRGR